MKKSFLLLTAGLLSVLSSQAQENTSIMLSTGSKSFPTVTNPGRRDLGVHPKMNRLNRDARTTAGAYTGEWFDFNVAHDDGSFVAYDGTTNSGNYGAIDVFPDSTLYVAAGTPPFYWWCHGLGTSFDPTSLYFQTSGGSSTTGLWANTTVSGPSFVVSPANDYYVDSIYVIGRFYQTNSTEDDTLHIDVIAPSASATNEWDLHYGSTNCVTWGITTAPDTNYRFALGAIDSNGYAGGDAPVYRITKVLNHAAAIDTDATSGWSIWSFAIPGGPIHVGAGGHVSALTTFHTGAYYPYGTAIAAANMWVNESWYFADNDGALQKANDFNTGLVVSTEERYNYSTAESYSGNTIPHPSYFYTGPLSVLNPHYGWFLRDPSSTSVNKVVPVTKVNAYPNPATNELNITFSSAANATVTLTNMVGQVVATQTNVNGAAKFNTAALANGMYIFTIQANGERTTGHVVVAH